LIKCMNAKLLKLPLILITIMALYFAPGAASAFAQERKIERGSRIVVRNAYGSISITGWERETIEAVATDASRAETVPVGISENSSDSKRIVIAVTPENKLNFKGKIRLEVKIPRYVELEPIKAESDAIAVYDMEGFVHLKTNSGDIKIVNAGSVQARTGNGNISLENIQGHADLITTNGNIKAQRIRGDTRIISVNAKINIECVKGRVEISDTSSQIWLIGIEGDVDVSTSNGKAYFIGPIRSENRYRLKTLSGAVSMSIPGNIGFTVTLSSYMGKIEKDFTFQNDSTFRNGKTDQRFIGKYGDGKAQIELDSFDGRVSLSKISPAAAGNCESPTVD
jgi:DUF4097 and DUF4098 domain-containing protein YvlB